MQVEQDLQVVLVAEVEQMQLEEVVIHLDLVEQVVQDHQIVFQDHQ